MDATGLNIDVIILAYESGKLPKNLDLLEVKTIKAINIIVKSAGILSIAAEGGKIFVDRSDPVPHMKVGGGLLIIEFACPEVAVLYALRDVSGFNDKVYRKKAQTPKVIKAGVETLPKVLSTMPQLNFTSLYK